MLLETAPAVIYSFKASGDYAPTFVSENIKRLLGYCPKKYLKNADFWRKRVHPEACGVSPVRTQERMRHRGAHERVVLRMPASGTSRLRWMSFESAFRGET